MSHSKIWLATYKGGYTDPKDVVLIENLTSQQYRRLRDVFGPHQGFDHVWDYMEDPKVPNSYLTVRLNHWRRLASE